MVHDRRLTTVPILALFTATITTLVGGNIFPGWIPIDAAAGLAVPFGALFGAYGAIGVGLGSLGRAAAVGSLSPPLLARIGAHVVIGLVAAAVWRSFSMTGSGRSLPIPDWMPRYLVTIVISVAAGASVMGLALEFLSWSPFFLAAGRTAAFATAALLVGTPVMALANRLGIPILKRCSDGQSASRTLSMLALCSYGWLFLGTLGSIGYRWFDVLYSYQPNALRVLDAEFLLFIYNDALFGQGAVRAQIVLGGVMGALLALSVWRGLDPAMPWGETD